MDGREQFRHEDAAWAHLANTTAIFPGEDIPAQLVPDGDGAMMLLRTIKTALDTSGILNSGALIP